MTKGETVSTKFLLAKSFSCDSAIGVDCNLTGMIFSSSSVDELEIREDSEKSDGSKRPDGLSDLSNVTFSSLFLVTEKGSFSGIFLEDFSFPILKSLLFEFLELSKILFELFIFFELESSIKNGDFINPSSFSTSFFENGNIKEFSFCWLGFILSPKIEIFKDLSSSFAKGRDSEFGKTSETGFVPASIFNKGLGSAIGWFILLKLFNVGCSDFTGCLFSTVDFSSSFFFEGIFNCNFSGTFEELLCLLLKLASLLCCNARSGYETFELLTNFW